MKIYVIETQEVARVRNKLGYRVIRRNQIGQVFLTVCVLISLLLPVSVAQANIIDRVKDIYQLPDNFNKMQQEYDATKQQLEEQKQKLTEQKDKLAEAMQSSKETQDQLLAQNRQLQEQNASLQQRLQAMENAANDKANRNRKLTYIISTAIALIVLYFVSGRLFRLAVWRRQKGRFRH
jgi:septal ring factor EnvC (AmiA/AmiB activator)